MTALPSNARHAERLTFTRWGRTEASFPVPRIAAIRELQIRFPRLGLGVGAETKQSAPAASPDSAKGYLGESSPGGINTVRPRACSGWRAIAGGWDGN